MYTGFNALSQKVKDLQTHRHAAPNALSDVLIFIVIGNHGYLGHRGQHGHHLSHQQKSSVGIITRQSQISIVCMKGSDP